MKGLIITLVAIAAIGIPAYMWTYGSSFDISAGTPMGDLATIDAYLKQLDFTKSQKELSEETLENYSDELEGVTLYEYVHEFKDSMDPRRSVVIIAVDAQGQLAAIRTGFRSAAAEMQAAINVQRAMMFTNRYWVELAGGKPSFVEQIGKSRMSRMSRTAGFSVRGIKGRWTKMYMTNQDDRSIYDSVSFTRESNNLAAVPMR